MVILSNPYAIFWQIIIPITLQRIMKQLLRATTAAVLMYAAVSGAQASTKIYTCTINGELVYTSRPSGTCQSTDLPVIGKYSSAPYDAAAVFPPSEPSSDESAKKSANAAKPKSTAKAKPKPAPIRPAPSVAAAPTPKPSGNSSRRSILETELSNERKALSDAQKSLAQARVAKGGHVNRQEINTLQSAVFDRQQNIQALQRELGRM